MFSMFVGDVVMVPIHTKYHDLLAKSSSRNISLKANLILSRYLYHTLSNDKATEKRSEVTSELHSLQKPDWRWAPTELQC
jgi:hypothetical protein